jgi:hypothetical protein
MLCVLEIMSVIYGIMTLVRGRFSFGKTKEVRGAPAYVIGVVLLATIPVAVFAAVILNFDAIVKGDENAFQWGRVDWRAWMGDVIGVVGCWGTALVIAAAKAEPKVDDRRRVVDEEYDDYEDVPRRRYRDAGGYDDEDGIPRGRRRPDPDDYDDDRPRRRDDLDDRAR